MTTSGKGMMMMAVTGLRGVSAAYYVDIPVDTPAGAAVTAVFMTLIVIAILTYFYQRLKEQAQKPAGNTRFHGLLTIVTMSGQRVICQVS